MTTSAAHPGLASRPRRGLPRHQARELAALIPDSRLVLLDSRNHVLTAEEPAWRVFVSEVGRFLAEPDR